MINTNNVWVWVSDKHNIKFSSIENSIPPRAISKYKGTWVAYKGNPNIDIRTIEIFIKKSSVKINDKVYKIKSKHIV